MKFNDPSDNFNLLFHTGADFLSLLFLYELFVFSGYFKYNVIVDLTRQYIYDFSLMKILTFQIVVN